MGIAFATTRSWSLPREIPPPKQAPEVEPHSQATMPPVALARVLWSLPRPEIAKRDRAILPGLTKWRAPCVLPGARLDEFAAAQRQGPAGTAGPADKSPSHKTHLGREGFADPPAATRFRAPGVSPFRS